MLIRSQKKCQEMKINLVSKPVLLIYFLLFSFLQSYSQSPASATYNQSRLKGVVITESVLTTVGFIGLHYLWYKKFPHSRFHFFDDSGEWLQMDKMGHATTAYNLSSIQYNMMRWSGVKNNTATWVGGLTALGFQTIIEIFDGFSSEWGFSRTDMLANIVGTALFMSQQFAFNEQRVQLKFSFHPTIFPKYNPGELGNNRWQSWLKDYNGQTYWLSINPSSFMKTNTDFPRWLNLSVGYGATGMTGAEKNPTMVDGKPIPYFKRIRQYYFSADADLMRISKTNNSSKTFLAIPEMIKFPAPTIEIQNDSRLKYYWLYF